MDGGLFSLEDIAAATIAGAGTGGETSGGPEFVFGRKGNYRAIALEKAKTAPPGLPLSIVGDGTGFEANHFLVVEAFGDPDVQEAIKQMYPEGWDVNSYVRYLPATDAALRAVEQSNTPYTAAMHRARWFAERILKHNHIRPTCQRPQP